MLQTANAMHALLLPPQQRLRRGRRVGKREGRGEVGGVRGAKKIKTGRQRRVATSPARLQVNQPPILGDKADEIRCIELDIS